MGHNSGAAVSPRASAVDDSRGNVTFTGPDPERVSSVRRALEEHKLDALIVRLPDNVLLLSGFWPMIGASHVIVPAEGEAVAIIPNCYEGDVERDLTMVRGLFFPHGRKDSPPPFESVAKLLRSLPGAAAWKRVGWEGTLEAAAPAWNSADMLFPTAPTRALYADAFSAADLVDASPVLTELKKRKTARELERMRLASEIANIGMEAFERAVAPGRSGVELVAEVEHAIMAEGTGYKGARRVRGYAQVATGGAECAIGFRPNEISTTRRLQDGDTALLELGVVVDGYWSDRTRPRVAGHAREEQAEAYELVLRAQEAAIAAAAPGVPAGRVDEAARSVIESVGKGDLFPHITGHGLGFAYHEPSPIIRPGSQEVLEEGMVHSVEPGVYSRELGGLRLEDDIYISRDGSEVLGPFRKELTE